MLYNIFCFSPCYTFYQTSFALRFPCLSILHFASNHCLPSLSFFGSSSPYDPVISFHFKLLVSITMYLFSILHLIPSARISFPLLTSSCLAALSQCVKSSSISYCACLLISSCLNYNSFFVALLKFNHLPSPLMLDFALGINSPKLELIKRNIQKNYVYKV